MTTLSRPCSGAGSVGRRLSSDPLQHPLPGGSAGEYADYARSSGTEPYYHDGTLWNPLYSGFPVMTIPTATNLVYALSADDVDGDRTFNSAYSDLSAIPTWANRSDQNVSGASIVAPTGVTNTFATPTLVKPCFRGRDAIAFNGNFDRMDMSGSASTLVTPHQTGLYEMMLGVNVQTYGRNVGLMGNTISASEKGFELDITTTNKITFLIVGGTGTVVTFKTTSGEVNHGALSLINIHGNGTTNYISIDQAAEETSTIAPAQFGAGNATRDYMFGVQNSAGGATKQSVTQWAFCYIWSAELSLYQRRQFFAEFNRVYK